MPLLVTELQVSTIQGAPASWVFPTNPEESWPKFCNPLKHVWRVFYFLRKSSSC